MDDLQIARATAVRDIFGSSDSGSSSYENLGCENNAISLADEITSLNVVQEQDLNISSHPLPVVGMLFDSVDELLTAYQDHAKEKGFAVAIRSSVRDTSSQFKYVSISCDRGRNTYFEKHSKRINCPAKVRAVRQGDNCWSVSKVVVEHNHELIPNLSCFMRGHRKMSMHMKRQLDANDIAGIRPCKSIRMLQIQSGGPENLGCTPRDCRNFVDARRRLRLGEGDAEAIRKLFIAMQERDRNFFHTFEVDNHSRLLNILWVHSRSRAAFEEFSDVVSFDTTYLVNRYRMPFATMVGVNHHGQSILLGCALISHEDVKSFDWLFTNWIRAMGNVYPRCILTDQCESIKAAIRKVMPDSIHRFCLWHIMCKVPMKFGSVLNYESTVKEFKNVVYDSLSIELFERNWNEFVRKNSLENHVWLNDLYAQRESWVPVFLNNNFWAGMVSTQRSEGMHAFFDNYITSNSTLKQFVEQYEVAITDKIQNELKADFDSKNEVMKLHSGFHWERQFHDAYTKDIFKKVQREIADMIYCHLDPNNEIDVSSVPSVEKFNIKECGISNWYCKEFLYTVEFRANGQYFDCNCRKFDFCGLLCKHIFEVMKIKNITRVHERYILRRWRKDVLRRHSSIVYSGGYPHMTDEYKKFQEIEHALHEAVDLCKNNPASMGFLKREMDALIEKIRSGDIQVDQAQHMDNDASIQGPNYASIRDPTYVRCRGRPRVNRFRSVRERGNSSQGRRNGPRHGRQSRHGGRRVINSVTIHNSGEDIIDLNEPFIESQNSNVARLNRSLSQPNGPRRGIQSRRGGRMPMTFRTVHNSGEDFVDLNEPIIESQNNNGRILMH